jgi:hypothetical protein
VKRVQFLHVVAVRHLRDHVLWLRFNDGAEGEVDLGNELYGPVFEPLKDVAYFSQVFIHPESETIAWPNDADLAPEFLRDLLVEKSVD